MAASVVKTALLKIVTSDGDTNAKLDMIAAKAKEIGTLNPEIAVKVNAAAAAAQMAVIRAGFKDSVRAMNADSAGAAAGAAAAGAAASKAGGFFGFLKKDISLFGGAFGETAFIGTVTGLHLLIDGAIEFASVLIPATIGVLAFGAAAAPAVEDIWRQFSALNTVVSATGQNIAPLSGGFGKMAGEVKPEVYQLLGDALTFAGQKGGGFAQVATSTGSVLDQLAARFTVASTSGHGFGGFMASAAKDTAGLGDLAANLGGVLGNVIKETPGYAEMLLGIADAGSHVLEWASNAAGPVLHWGMVAHGAFLYAGLAATGVANILPKVLGGVGNLALSVGTAGGKLEGMGALGEKAAGGLRVFGGAAADAATLPWGWIAIAAAGVGFLAYEMFTAKDATEQWISGMRQALQNMPAIRGYTQSLADQAAVATQLAHAQVAVAQAQKDVTVVLAGRGGFEEVLTNTQQAQSKVMELTSGQKALAASTDLYNMRLSLLSKTYGSTSIAQGLLIASGVTFGEMTSKSANTVAIMRQQVSATDQAYAAMGQKGGALGADMFLLTQQANGQYTAMANLNKAWSTFLGMSTGLMGAQTSIAQSFTTMKTDSAAAGASLTGVDTASVTLRNDYIQLVTQTQSVVGGMRQAGASSRDMASVLATDLSPAIRDGALKVTGMRDQLYAMARQAGYTGNNAIAPLTGWFGKNATSLYKATQMADNYSGALARIPKSSGTAFSTPGLASALANADQLQATLGALNKMSVTTYVHMVDYGSPPVGAPSAPTGGGNRGPNQGPGSQGMVPGLLPVGTGNQAQWKAQLAYELQVRQAAEQYATLGAVQQAAGSKKIGSKAYLTGLQGYLAKIKKFDADIGKLGHEGLDKALLQEIVSYGVDTGLPIAEALLSGPIARIYNLNKTERGIQQASGRLGRTAGGVMFGGQPVHHGHHGHALAQAQKVNVEFDFRGADAATVSFLKKAVRARGGDPAVFGR